MTKRSKASETISVVMIGSGGVGVVTAGNIFLDAAAHAGWYGLMMRSAGPQIRGGESVAFIRLGSRPVGSLDDAFDIMVAYDWVNFERFAAEVPLNGDSLVICDPEAGDIPEVIIATGARIAELPLKDTAKGIPGGRSSMVGLGALGAMISLPEAALTETLDHLFKGKGEEILNANRQSIRAGRDAAQGLEIKSRLKVAASTPKVERWNISGNEAAGLGAVRAGLRFAAAYPITPSTDMLEWLAPNLEKLGGVLVQAEDELSSINMIIGGSFGGVPALTATSGPGLALMMESIGLAVASEIPIVIVNVMRGGPSTGIPTKSEQSDLNIAVYGLHGDAPHIVTAPNSVDDCLFTTQWSMYLAEALQCPAIVLSDQALGQARMLIDHPADPAFVVKRETVAAGVKNYQRYALTASGISPMAIPGTPDAEYVADGLEHMENGKPSAQAEHHRQQLDKRQRKLTDYDFGCRWADIVGEGDTAVVTWGSSTDPVREALARAAAEGVNARLISMRLLLPAQAEKFRQAVKEVKRLLIVEQTHSGQFHRYLRAHYDLPGEVKVFKQPGPLPIRPGQIHDMLVNWK